jgi:hypothetical protein
VHEHTAVVESSLARVNAAERAVSEVESLIENCAVISTNNITLFACSAEKGSAAAHHQSLRDLVYIINKGVAPPGTKHELFHDKKRLLGSCTDKPLPDGVTEATGPVDFGAPIKRVELGPDGCAGQYEGLKTYLGVQLFVDDMKNRYVSEPLPL